MHVMVYLPVYNTHLPVYKNVITWPSLDMSSSDVIILGEGGIWCELEFRVQDAKEGALEAS